MARGGPRLASVAQDYPSLSVLVIDAASVTDPTPRVAAALPGAYVRRLDARPRLPGRRQRGAERGRGRRLLRACCHDDVAPDPDAVRLLVEEALRSNAGIVGPKLVEWDAPERLLAVGLAVDKTGAVAPVVERGELDQEQHDAVRDVFAVPGRVPARPQRPVRRARRVRPRDAASRATTSTSAGAPSSWARGCWWRRRRGCVTSRPRGPATAGWSPRAAGAAAHHRLRATLKNYSRFHLVRVLAPGDVRHGRAGACWRPRRGRMADARGLAVGVAREPPRACAGCARCARPPSGFAPCPTPRCAACRWAAARSCAPSSACESAGARASAPSPRPGATWPARCAVARHAPPPALLGVLVLAVVIGSRHLVGSDVPAVGQLAPFPDSPFTFLRHFAHRLAAASGLGVEAPAPPAFAFLGGAGFLVLGHMSLLRTLLVLGAWPVGAIGAWRLTRDLGAARARDGRR